MFHVSTTKTHKKTAIFLATTLSVIYLILAFRRWLTFHNQTFDLAFYARMAWGFVHAEGYEPIVGGIFLGLHISPILLPLAILGFAFSTVPILLIAQACAVGAAAWPLSKLASKHLTHAAYAAPLAVLVWLFYPNLSHVLTEEFHPGTLAVLPMAWMALALDQGRFDWLKWGILGTLSCREDLALVCVIAAGLFWWRYQKPNHLYSSLKWAGACLMYLSLFVLVLHPVFAPPQGSAQLHFAKWGGGGLFKMFLFMLGHPAEVMRHFLSADRLSYLPRLLLPLAGFALCAPWLLVPALPILIMNLVSDFPGTTDISSHYLTPSVPWIMGATWQGLGRLGTWLNSKKTPVFCLGLAICVCHVTQAASPLSLGFDSSLFTKDQRSEAAALILSLIPKQASVQAPDELLPHLAERVRVHRSPPPERGTHYVVLNIEHRLAFAHQEDLLRTAQEPWIRAWLARADHATLASVGPYLLLKKGIHPRESSQIKHSFGQLPSQYNLLSPIELTDCLSVISRIITDKKLTLGLKVHASCPGDIGLRIGTGLRPNRVDLLFQGLLSPIHLQSGDFVLTEHDLDQSELRAIRSAGLRIGIVRSSGSRPRHEDPTSVEIPL